MIILAKILIQNKKKGYLMLYKNLIKNMLKMQQKLNDNTCGLGWENGYTKQAKLINFKRCIYMECAELMDSFPWKHWKNVSSNNFDKKNIQIEIVDIWHFLLSLFLEVYKEENLGDFEKISEDICSTNHFTEFCQEAHNLDEINIYEVMNDIEIIIHQTSGFGYKIYDILSNFFILSIKCGLNLNLLYKIYIGKNVLNQFRQDQGYKEGTYIKIWQGREDNEVLNGLLKENLSEEELYSLLEEEYKKVKEEN